MLCPNCGEGKVEIRFRLPNYGYGDFEEKEEETDPFYGEWEIDETQKPFCSECGEGFDVDPYAEWITV